MNIRIVSEGGLTRVLNAETGEKIDGCTSIRFEHASPTEIPTITLERFAGLGNRFEIEAQGFVTAPIGEPRHVLAQAARRLDELGETDLALKLCDLFEIKVWEGESR